jgi:hypothetical protein
LRADLAWGIVRRMKASRLALFALTLAIPRPAFAQYDDLSGAEKKPESDDAPSGENRFGIGVEALLSGLFAGSPSVGGIPLGGGGGGGAAFIFDATQWRIEGALGLTFVEDTGTGFGLAARFLWVVHSTSRSDLGVGAAIGVSHNELEGPFDVTLFHAEGLVQLRFFVVSNVALHGGIGLGLAVGDGATVLGIGGTINGLLGMSYFFD